MDSSASFSLIFWNETFFENYDGVTPIRVLTTAMVLKCAVSTIDSAQQSSKTTRHGHGSSYFKALIANYAR